MFYPLPKPVRTQKVYPFKRHCSTCCKPKTDMVAPHPNPINLSEYIRTLKRDLPFGVSIAGEGLLFRHSVLRGRLFQPLLALFFGLLLWIGGGNQLLEWGVPPVSDSVYSVLTAGFSVFWMWRMERWWYALTTCKSVYIDDKELVVYGAFGRVRYRGRHDAAYSVHVLPHSLYQWLTGGVALLTDPSGRGVWTGMVLGLHRHNLGATLARKTLADLPEQHP